MRLFRKLINLLRGFGINANKIELSANDVLNLLAGNTINLTSKNIVLSSSKFGVDKNGKMACSDAQITGGKIKVAGSDSGTDLLRVENSSNSSEFSYIQPIGAGFIGSGGRIDIMAEHSRSDTSNITLRGSNGYTSVRNNGITTPKVTQESLEKYKKNIAKTEGVLNIIRNSEIYTYNLKTEKDTDKKHTGFVIGEQYNTPREVISNEEDGIDTYSMTAILWKAVQELLEKVEVLENNKNI